MPRPTLALLLFILSACENGLSPQDAGLRQGDLGAAGDLAQEDLAAPTDDAGVDDLGVPDLAVALDGAPPLDLTVSVCSTTVTAYPIAASPHVEACTFVAYTTAPASSGPHYPSWAAFKAYDAPVPKGFLVHALEHGAVTLHYNCPGGCAAEVAQLGSYLASRSPDPLCAAPLRHRFIVSPDPTLPARFGAAAWGHTLLSGCLDLPALGAFLDAHYARAPEDLCFDGVDVLSPAAGVPAGCGEPDGGT